MDDEFEQVILVDEDDAPLHDGDKWRIHQEGLLHRAFSIFVFDSVGDCLIQRRAMGKYHSAGKWANSCCGHPRPGEATLAAAERRLTEEVGLMLSLTFGFKSRYIAYLDNEMIENEIPHLYFGRTLEAPVPNPIEVSHLRWVPLETLAREIVADPAAHAAWLRHYVDAHASDLAHWRDKVCAA